MASAAQPENLLMPTNMLGAAVPHRLAMGLPPSVPVSLGNAVVAPSRNLRGVTRKHFVATDGSISLSSLRTLGMGRDVPNRFQHSRSNQPTMLGGSMRVSASDAALLALSVPPMPKSPNAALAKQRPRTRDPLLGEVPPYVPSASPATPPHAPLPCTCMPGSTRACVPPQVIAAAPAHRGWAGRLPLRLARVCLPRARLDRHGGGG